MTKLPYDLPVVLCEDCANAGLFDVEMRFMFFDWQWMTVMVSEPGIRFADQLDMRPQRQKLRCTNWSCPHGHRHQEIFRAEPQRQRA